VITIEQVLAAIHKAMDTWNGADSGHNKEVATAAVSPWETVGAFTAGQVALDKIRRREELRIGTGKTIGCEAILALRDGDLAGALFRLRDCANLEDRYGASPVWSLALHVTAEWIKDLDTPIRMLRDKAQAEGQQKLVTVCDLALDGNRLARLRCVKQIVEAACLKDEAADAMQGRR